MAVVNTCAVDLDESSNRCKESKGRVVSSATACERVKITGPRVQLPLLFPPLPLMRFSAAKSKKLNCTKEGFCDGENNTYSGRKITASLGNVTVWGEKIWKEQGGSAMANSLSMYSITENIYCSQLSSVAILLQTERNCFTSYNTTKGLSSLSLCAIVLRSSPPSYVSTCNGQRSSQLFCVHYMLTEETVTPQI
jgi:hypothetical protein